MMVSVAQKLDEEQNSGKEISPRHKKMVARYSFGDASGSGFESSYMEGSKGIRYKVGIWDGADEGDESSNFKEITNLITTLKDTSNENDFVCGAAILLFTDNSVTEGTVFRRSST